MTKFTQIVFLIALFVLGIGRKEAQATHLMGADMQWKCLGNDTYEIKIVVYRRCTDGATTLSIYPPTVTSDSCANSYTVTVGSLIEHLTEDITPVCASQQKPCPSAGGNGQLAKAVARYYYKLLAHKDEFEVARLYAHPDFQAQLDQTFEGGYQLRFHLAGGPFGRVNAGRVNAATGKPAKTELGPWMMRAFRVLAALRFLRGSVFDPFRHSAERKLGVELLAQYEADLSLIEGKLQQDNYTVATALATWPEQVRGYGHVRAAHAQRARLEREKRLAQFSAGPMKIAVNT